MKLLSFLMIFGAVMACFCSISTAADANALGDVNVVDANVADHIDNDVVDIYVDYQPLLEKYVSDDGLVNYGKLRRRRLEMVPQALEFSTITTDEIESWPIDKQKAFWVNAYNFSVMSLVVKNYPVKSTKFGRWWWPANCVMQIDGFYTEQFVVIAGLEYNLKELEFENLAQKFQDPRLCFAINRATMDSAELCKTPYRHRTLDKQLDEQIKKFFAHKKAISREGDTLYLSIIFKDNEELFVTTYGKRKKFRSFEPNLRAALNFIDTHGSDENRETISGLTPENITVMFEKNNWRYLKRLNDTNQKAK